MALRVNFKVLVGIFFIKKVVYLMILFSLQLPLRHEIGSGPTSVRISNLLICCLSENRDVVIKVVAKGHEGLNELKILELLNVEPLKSHPASVLLSCHFVMDPTKDHY